MTLRIAVLGDSMAQGVVHGAALKPQHSFGAMVAEACGLSVGVEAEAGPLPDFVVPSFFRPGLPFNIERVLNDAEFWSGPRLGTLGNELNFVAFAALEAIRNRRYFSQSSPPGEMRLGPPDHLAIAGLSVRDCIELTPEECDDRIESAGSTIDGLLAATAPEPLLRIAKHVLNAKGVPARQTWSALRCFQHVVENRKPTDVLIHLGNADILGAVADLDIKMMPPDFRGDRGAREAFNVTHPDVFRDDYMDLGERIQEIFDRANRHPRVFIGTLPPSTIAPFIHGFGKQDQNGYFDLYGRFFVRRAPAFRRASRTLSREDVILLDDVVRRYNAAICCVAKKHGWQVVHVGKMVRQLAVRRNFMEASPSEPLRKYVTRLLRHDPRHDKIEALLGLEPVPDVGLFRADPYGQRIAGGLFGFDCGHPSTLGYGLVADRFLRKMRAVGAAPPAADIDWSKTIARAHSVVNAPRLWEAVLTKLEAHPVLFDFVFGSRYIEVKEKLVAEWGKLRVRRRGLLHAGSP